MYGAYTIHGLNACPNLRILDLSGNDISRMSYHLDICTKLQTLMLNRNQLISTQGVHHLSNLMWLELDNNHLPDLESVESCPLLRHLSAEGNGIMEFPPLHNHAVLSSLRLADNSISTLAPLINCWLPSLQCLNLANNSIQELPETFGLSQERPR